MIQSLLLKKLQIKSITMIAETSSRNCECGKDIVISASEKSEFNCMEVKNRTQAI
jgi:hypothetical protein